MKKSSRFGKGLDVVLNAANTIFPFAVAGIVTTVLLDFHVGRTYKHIESIVESRAELYEEQLGIAHDEDHFTLPATLSAPRILSGTAGGYLPENDVLIFNPNHIVFKGNFIFNLAARITTLNAVHDATYVTDHELGHHYIDKISESMGNGDWPELLPKKIEHLPTHIISQGLAEYFEHDANNIESGYSDSDYPSNLDDFLKSNHLYDGGENLVAPIVDAYGRRGIEYLILNLPTLDDFSDLPAYRSRVMEALASSK